MSANQQGCAGCCPGPMGPQGPVGPQGAQGIMGPQGARGVDGMDGMPGKNGVDGMPGMPGKGGAMGAAGPMGAQGAQGAAGAQGPKGDQGMPGVNGMDGKNGKDGVQGIQGMQGLQGPKGDQGPMGPKGDCIECPCNCDVPEFAEVYSITTQELAPSVGPNLQGQTCILEKTIFASANIDVSNAAVNGKIVINKAGWYDVSTGISGALNPIPSPIPVWTLSLFVNGVIVPGSTFANQTISPEQKANEIVADVFVHFNKGDVLELCNTSINKVFMSAPTYGTNAQTNSAYMKMILLKAD